MPHLQSVCFTRSPFRLKFPLGETFAHPSWECALRDVTAGVALGAWTVLVGEPGTGKTLLLQVLDQNLRSQGSRVRRLCAGDPVSDVAGTEILLIDEADLFDAVDLETIGRLANPIVMAGLPGLLERLSSCPRPFRTARLERLGAEDIARFVRGRLAASEHPLPAFTPEAVLALRQQSGGLFRLVTILAGAGLFFAEQRGSSKVAACDIEDAASLRTSVFEAPEARTLAGLMEEPTQAGADTLAVADGEGWWPRRTYAVLGWSGWMAASLGVVILAVAAASAFTRLPPQQMVQGLPPPTVAATVAPTVAPTPANHVAVASVSTSSLPVTARPPPVVASLPPPVEPIARPGVRQAEAGQAEAGQTQAGQAETSQAVSGIPPLGTEPLGAASLGATAAETRSMERPPTVLVFSGPIMNDTMGQAGTLSLKMLTGPSGGRVSALFHASHGLIGSGILSGAVGPGGKVRLAGQLMMGRNPFACEFYATLEGGRLVGEATFVRHTTGVAAHSTFALSKL